MKKKIIILTFFCCFKGFSQDTQQKIKVVLLGTFHYGATSDAHSTDFPDLFTPIRQTQLDDIAQKISLLKPDKIFVENIPSSQKKLDSLYAVYQKNELKDTVKYRSETFQLGFRMAKFSQLKQVLAVDYRMELPFDELREAQKNISNMNKDTLMKLIARFPSFFQQGKPFNSKTFPKLSSSTLIDHYIFINSRLYRHDLMYDYLHQPMTMKYFNDSVGIKYTAIWYERNLHIFNNILLNLSKNDKTIVVLFGGAHTAVLRQYFENHPFFEIVELDNLLK